MGSWQGFLPPAGGRGDDPHGELAAPPALPRARQPPYRRARAALRYDDASRGLILGFKHGDRTEAAPAFARWLAAAGDFADIDLVAPVPLHWRRLFRRRYNQAALLALALGRLVDRPVVADLLVRRRSTPTQGRLGAAARRRNVAGAFSVLAGAGRRWSSVFRSSTSATSDRDRLIRVSRPFLGAFDESFSAAIVTTSMKGDFSSAPGCISHT